MIDFRYHIVSLVAVFLALAIGIVIGGFTLRGEVGNTLNAQVVQLREEKNALRQEVSQTSTELKRREAYAAGTLPLVVSGTLTGQAVAVVVLPGTDGSLVRSTTGTLREAGATVASTSYLSPDWAGGDFAAAENFTGMAKTLHLDPTVTPTDRLPGAVLGRAVAAGSPGGSTARRATVLHRMVADKLLTVHPSHPAGASAVVVLWSGMSGSGSDNSEAKVTGWTNVIAAVGSSVTAVVGVSSGDVGGDPSTPDALVSSLRRTPDSAARMSTVDDGALPMGQGALALALEAELHGTSGQYGVGHDAVSTMPRTGGS